jgi:Protein phosphatase 2C
VRQRTSDDKPVRVSRNEEWKGTKAIRRVAGSLAVTRAIGDAYLKLPQLRSVCDTVDLFISVALAISSMRQLFSSAV